MNRDVDQLEQEHQQQRNDDMSRQTSIEIDMSLLSPQRHPPAPQSQQQQHTPTSTAYNKLSTATLTPTTNNNVVVVTSPRHQILMQQLDQLLHQKSLHSDSEVLLQKLSSKITRQNQNIIELQSENLMLRNENYQLKRQVSLKDRELLTREQELKEVRAELKHYRLITYQRLLLSSKVETQNELAKRLSSTDGGSAGSGGSGGSGVGDIDHIPQLDLSDLAELAVEQNVPMQQVHEWYQLQLRSALASSSSMDE